MSACWLLLAVFATGALFGGVYEYWILRGAPAPPAPPPLVGSAAAHPLPPLPFRPIPPLPGVRRLVWDPVHRGYTVYEEGPRS